MRAFRAVTSAYTMQCEWGKNFLLLINHMGTSFILREGV
jgi:hypothetical protein